MTTEEFIKKAKEIHGDKYDYSLSIYIKYKQKVKIICPLHGVFEQTPDKHLQKRGCSECANVSRREKMTKISAKEFTQKAKEVHGDKYDYSLVDYKNNKTKIKIICPVHGVFEQKPTNHLQGHKCPECTALKGGRKKTTEEFIKEAKTIYGDKYDYSLVNYKGAHIKVKIICPKHGVFEMSPNTHLHLQGCRICKLSKGEERIKSCLEAHGFILNKTYFKEKKFENLFQKKGFCLRYDFYIPSKNLLVEYNGIQHYDYKKSYFFKGDRNKFLLRKHYDWLKRKYARDNGYKLLIIPYWDYKIIEEILEEEII